MKSPNSRQVRAAATLGSSLMLAPMVVAMRLPLLASEWRIDAIGAEATRAVTEKTIAMADGLMAAQLSYLQSAMRFWPEVMAGATPALLSGAAAQRSLHAALTPAGRRVKANYRRLSRRA